VETSQIGQLTLVSSLLGRWGSAGSMFEANVDKKFERPPSNKSWTWWGVPVIIAKRK
jgi:hypothetical protein